MSAIISIRSTIDDIMSTHTYLDDAGNAALPHRVVKVDGALVKASHAVY